MNVSSAQKMVLNNLRAANNLMDDATRKLSSGVNINSSADDPAGMARVMKMRATSRGLNIAIQNVSDDLKMLRTLDAPLGNMQNMVIRIKSLALRASNEATLRDDCRDRSRLDAEAQKLIKEIDREAKAVSFNTKYLLSGNRVEYIKPILSTQQTIKTDASHPGWEDNDAVTYTAKVDTTGVGTGGRAGQPGDFSYRFFTTEIDKETNAPLASTQLTSDPQVLQDADGDGYFDAALNDPFTASAALPGPPLTDGDGDGFPLQVDNNDAVPVPGDATYLAPAVSSTSKTFVPLNNVVSREFTAASDVDEIVGTSTVAFDISYSTDGGVSYNPLGSYGAGAFNIQPAGLPGTTTHLRFEVAAGSAASSVSLTTLEDAANNPIGILSTTYATNPSPMPDNRADYDLAALISDSADQINFTVAAGVNYTVSYRSVITGGFTNAVGVGTGGAVNIDLAAADEANYIRVTIDPYKDVTTDFTLNSVSNRKDRDGDGYPDIIERASDPSGGEEKNGAAYPFGATHAYAGGINDTDGDGVPDYPEFYDPYDGTAPTDPRDASTIDLGGSWTAGTGNAIIQPTSPGANYAADGPVNPNEIPTKIDTDGDTIPDPFDPFDQDAEFTTWVDGGGAYKGNNSYFVSNRANPNDPAAASQYLYQLDDNGVYSVLSVAGDVDNPVLSYDGSALAWEQGAEIWISYVPEDCTTATAVTKKLVDVGNNPTWSPDNSQVAYDRGGQIYVTDAASGVETALGIAGENPDWSPDGDNIAYTSGGNIFVYNFGARNSFDTGIAGDDPAWSPDGGRMAFEDGADIAVVNFTIYKDQYATQIGQEQGEDYSLQFSLPDARSTSIGLSSLKINTQANAVDAIDTADEVLDTLISFRAELSTIENRLAKTLDDLYNQQINVEAGRSKIEDADMAAEVAKLVTAQLLKNTSEAYAAQASNFIETKDLSVLSSNLVENGIRAQFRRLVG